MADDFASDSPEKVTPPGPPVNTVVELRSRVQALIGSSTPIIVEQIVQTFVKQERDRRVELLMDGLKRHGDADVAFKKHQPDMTMFEADNVTVQARAWSAPKRADMEKSKKALDKLTVALNDAIAHGNFKNLEDIIKGGGDKRDDRDA